ncbi:aminopeptidase N [Deinococcus metalli]|uniref:Aminopeptidase N n=1 Tax=Deinococcus metalli TaxID=1141878 RepID=A0A7W8KBC6_9DEIO|nr:M1 family metallopeptidase [Deinococcus metalli]MBB5374608.1 aminopeptidase N [Deinococcus metalli]GHF35053.1 zinc metalloprotease [Deinococcus metalli]
MTRRRWGQRSGLVAGVLLWAGAASGQVVPALPPGQPPRAVTVPPAEPIGDSIYPHLGQKGLDVLHYDVTLYIDQPGTRGLRGVAVLTLTGTRPLNVVSVDLLGPTVQDVRWNGQPAVWQQDVAAAKLRVTLPAPLPAGQRAQLTVTYAGPAGTLVDPELGLDLGWVPVQDAAGRPVSSYTLSEPDGTRTFLPVNDHPSDPATFTVHVTVPPGVVVAASGVGGAAREVAGGREFTFEQRQPIPTYALAVQVGPLERVDGPAVPATGPEGGPVQRRDYFPPDTSDAVRAPYAQVGEMLRVLSGWFGPFPFPVYGAAVITPRVPALETATLLTMPVSSSSERVIVHEGAHQWFGDTVVLGDWADVWLNEGFATYAELLWLESRGDDPGRIAATWYDRLRAQPTRPLVATTEPQLFDASAYLRGALALHALRAAVGDAAFRTFLRGYVQDHSRRPVRTADLLASAQRTLGPVARTVLGVWVESPTLPPLPAWHRLP